MTKEVAAFIRDVREKATRLRRQYRLSSAAALQEAFETLAGSVTCDEAMWLCGDAVRCDRLRGHDGNHAGDAGHHGRREWAATVKLQPMHAEKEMSHE